MYHNIVPYYAMVVNSNIRVYEAVLSNTHMVTNKNTWLYYCTFPDKRAVTDHFICRLKRAEAPYNFGISIKWLPGN